MTSSLDLYEHRDRDAVRHLFRVASLVSTPWSSASRRSSARSRNPSPPPPGRVSASSNTCSNAPSPPPSAPAPKPDRLQLRLHRVCSGRNRPQDLRFPSGPHRLPRRRGQDERARRPSPRPAGRGNHPRHQPHPRARPPHGRRVPGKFVPQVVKFDQIYETAATARHRDPPAPAPPSHLPSPDHAHSFMHRRRNKPMFFIDIAVPRDVDPEMNKHDGIFVYDIDDLQQVASAHLEERRARPSTPKLDRSRSGPLPPAPSPSTSPPPLSPFNSAPKKSAGRAPAHTIASRLASPRTGRRHRSPDSRPRSTSSFIPPCSPHRPLVKTTPSDPESRLRRVACQPTKPRYLRVEQCRFNPVKPYGVKSRLSRILVKT